MWKCQISKNLITSKHISRHQTMNIEGTWWWDSSRSYTIEGNYISCSILLNKIVFMGVSCSYCDTSIYFKQPKHVPNYQCRIQLTIALKTYISHKSCAGSMVSSQPSWNMCCKEGISSLMVNQHSEWLEDWHEPLFKFTL